MSDPNGRVTNAILATKLDDLIADVRETNSLVRQAERRIGKLESSADVCRSKWDEHGKLHDRERGILASISVIASVIAGWFGSRT